MQAEGPWGGGRGGLLYISAAVGGDFYLSLCGGGSDCCLLRQKRAELIPGPHEGKAHNSLRRGKPSRIWTLRVLKQKALNICHLDLESFFRSKSELRARKSLLHLTDTLLPPTHSLLSLLLQPTVVLYSSATQQFLLPIPFLLSFPDIISFVSSPSRK